MKDPYVNEPHLRVSVIPPWPGFENNALFNGSWSDRCPQSTNAHWMDWFAEVYKRASELGILFGTADVLPLDDADVVIYMAQPNSPDVVTAQKQKNPNLTTIL